MGQKHRSLSGWHPAEVKAEVEMRGQTLAGLARRHGFSESYLRNALMRPLYRGEQIISGFIGIPAQEIWPDRYDRSGVPNYRVWRKHRQRRAA